MLAGSKGGVRLVSTQKMLMGRACGLPKECLIGRERYDFRHSRLIANLKNLCVFCVRAR